MKRILDETSILETRVTEWINQGKQAGYRLLYREYYRALVSFGTRYLRQTEVVEDIVQELFTSIWKRALHFDSFAGLRTFLYTSTRNACLNELKRQRLKDDYLSSMRPEDFVEEPDDPARVKEEVYRVLFSIVERLPGRCRQVFELHLQGKKNEEIAALLGISIATVKTQKNRAMNLLREQMGDLYILALVLHVL
jgi:RNA polymerase sigma-70 factor (ECF subfamily)